MPIENKPKQITTKSVFGDQQYFTHFLKYFLNNEKNDLNTAIQLFHNILAVNKIPLSFSRLVDKVKKKGKKKSKICPRLPQILYMPHVASRAPSGVYVCKSQPALRPTFTRG